MRDLLKALKAAGDESRLRILNILRLRPLCVCEIAHVLGLAPSTVSRHLKILEDAGLLDRSKDGLWVEYSLAAGPGDPAARTLLDLVVKEAERTAQFRSDEKKARQADRRVLTAPPQGR